MNRIDKSPVSEWNHYDPEDRTQIMESMSPSSSDTLSSMYGFSIAPNLRIANIKRAIDGAPMNHSARFIYHEK
jgi:hypothetical protein